MAYWKRCPECGETNYFESSYSQQFDCGFKGSSSWDTRERRCGGKAKSSAAKAGVGALSDDVSRYRLALLDAARVADMIASDIDRGGAPQEHAGRVRELAEQMRAFAGHSADAGSKNFEDFAGRTGRAGSALSRWVRRTRLW